MAVQAKATQKQQLVRVRLGLRRDAAATQQLEEWGEHIATCCSELACKLVSTPGALSEEFQWTVARCVVHHPLSGPGGPTGQERCPLRYVEG